MNGHGFLLTRLALTGVGVPDAEIELGTGLNAISGPSDTGKTFIAQCIDFVLGASTLPKEIPEARAYDTARLTIRPYAASDECILERSLRGSDIRLRVNGQDDLILSARHDANNQNTVSNYLLTLSGLAGKIVRKNKRGTTRTLSFRDLARLVVVDEESVITEKSPILSGQYTNATAEKSVFRLLLTGVDDSSVIEAPEPTVERGRVEAKIEVLVELRGCTEQRISTLNLCADRTALQEQLGRVEALLNDVSAELTARQETLATLQERRQAAWAQLRHVDSRLCVLSELQGRFTLLGEQYSSDLRRLDSIAEAGRCLGQMAIDRCPVCGALAEHHDAQHRELNAAPDEVAAACQAEAMKIRALLADLQNTLAATADDIATLHSESTARQADLNEASREIHEQLQPRVQEALTRLRESQSERDTLRTAVQLFERLEELDRMQNALQGPSGTRTVDTTSSAVHANEAESFSRQVEDVLCAWRFPNLERVVFSEDKSDLVISGSPRASHGKGVRAITHAAFNVALLKYCCAKSMPHPGFLIIDSPLVVYREPDRGEDVFSSDVKDAFYRYLATHCGDAQVIILENEEPPPDLEASANIIKFTGADHGRRGFIPIVAGGDIALAGNESGEL